MANVNLIKQDNSTKVNITKGATQQALNSAVAQAESYRNESEGFSLDAEGFKNDASLSASQSAISATASATSATSSATSATNATTQANIATTKASEASTSASNALVSETNASTYATNASNSAIASANSSTASASSAIDSANSASASATSESNASGYATSAATSASNAAISEVNALSYANSINPSILLHTQGNGNGDPEGYTTAETDTLLSDKADNATTLSGYGITDAYTKTEVDNKPTGFKNYIINGGMDIWQRRTVFSNPANETWTADRWKIGWAGGTVTQVYKGGEAFSNGYNTLAIDGKAGNTVLELRQYIESLNCRKLKTGTKVTVSFDVFTNTGFIAKNLIVNIDRPIAIDGFSTMYDNISSTIALSAGSQVVRKSVTFTIPTNYFSWGTRLMFLLPTGLGAGETIAFGNVQFEDGSVATPFEQRPYGLELSLCQRYYEKCINNICIAGGGLGGLTDVKIPTEFKVTKRVPPSMTIIGDSTGTVTLINPFIELFIVFYSAGLNNNFGATLSADAEL